MNIIKFKDTVVEGQTWYNDNLRGKYAYWVRCRYVVPLESINQNMYVSFETTINNLLGFNYFLLTYDETNQKYTYIIKFPGEISTSDKNKAVLVEEVPTDPTELSPILIKTDHHHVEYLDLWEGRAGAWANAYIDHTETDNINSIDHLKQYNRHTPGQDLTLDDIKRFRTWLATSLYDVNYSFYKWDTTSSSYVLLEEPSLSDMQNAITCDSIPTEYVSSIIKINDLDIVQWTDEQAHVLKYYVDGMYDDTIKWLSEYGGVNVSSSTTLPTNNCGCSDASTNISSLYQGNVHVCDTISIYRAGLKGGMIEMFSSVKFWSQFESTYLLTIKRYIDGIIQTNLSMAASKSDSTIYSCECVNKNKQDSVMATLSQLSASFGYLADPESLSQHKNFITSTLSVWANNLYEYMEWS